MARRIRSSNGLPFVQLLSSAGLAFAVLSSRHGDLAAANGQDDAATVQADIELNEANYRAWRDHILPNESEMAWEQIPWLTTFKDGIAAADASEKPLLLWTMNGHPLGCT